MAAESAVKPAQRPADSRDMYAVHIMFRREFTELPGLIRAVAAGDRARTRIVADHAALITGLLHVHHHHEDTHCWPKIAARGPQDAAPLVGLMESQHQAVGDALRAVERKTAAWRESAAADDRDAAAAAAEEEVLPPLGEHLHTEERNMLPLIDRYLTADEWADVGNRGLATIPRSKVPLLFGMLLHDASDEHRELLRAAAPTPVFAVMSRIGPVAYKRYRRKLEMPALRREHLRSPLAGLSLDLSFMSVTAQEGGTSLGPTTHPRRLSRFFRAKTYATSESRVIANKAT